MRIPFYRVAPGAVEAMRGLEAYVRASGLEPRLLELVKTRVSQINGCAYCLDMHTQEARAHGESERRLHALAAWREAPFYTPHERAALAWAEALTLVHQGHVPHDVYEEARRHFTERELVDLSLAIVAINGWNRLAIAFRYPEPGSYRPPARERDEA